MIVTKIIDHFRWLFKPLIILKSCNKNPFFKVWGWSTLYFVSDIDLIKKIGKETGSIFLGGKGNEFLEPLLGNQSVFLLDGKKHKYARSAISKAIGARQVDNNIDKIQQQVNQFIDKFSQKRSIELTKDLRFMTFNIVMYFAFGKQNDHFISTLFDRIEKTTGVLANVVSYNRRFWRRKRPISVGHIVESMVNDIDTLIYERIEHGRNEHQYMGETSLDLLSIMLREQTKNDFDDAFIRDTLVSVLAAGYDTTGSALSWLNYWYANINSKDLQSLLEEKKQGKNKKIKSFIKESLRFCSPIEILPRKINPEKYEDAKNILGENIVAKLPNDYSLVAVCPFSVHHDEEVYNDPETFNIDRFVDKKMSPEEFLAFGSASRYCVGYILGQTVLETYISTLLERRFHILLSNKIKFSPVRRNVSLWPAYSLDAKLVDI